MAGYTRPAEWSEVPQIISDNAKAFFGNMPFYVPKNDAAYETALQDFQEQFLYRFYDRELGGETIGIFKLWLYSKFRDIMPYYAQLYKTTLIEYNITDTVDLYIDIEGSEAGEKSGDREETLDVTRSELTENKNSSESNVKDNTSTSGDTQNNFSDTPQNGLQSVIAGNYLTSATYEDRNESTESETASTGSSIGTTTKTNTGNDTRRYNDSEKDSRQKKQQEHRHGKEAGVTYAQLIREARENIININVAIMDECETLFMQIF